MQSLTRLRNAQRYAGLQMFGKSLHTPMLTGPQHQASNDMNKWMARPDASCDPIQDIDPESETFGQVFWMLDFDGLS